MPMIVSLQGGYQQRAGRSRCACENHELIQRGERIIRLLVLYVTERPHGSRKRRVWFGHPRWRTACWDKVRGEEAFLETAATFLPTKGGLVMEHARQLLNQENAALEFFRTTPFKPALNPHGRTKPALPLSEDAWRHRRVLYTKSSRLRKRLQAATEQDERMRLIERLNAVRQELRLQLPE